MEVERRMKEQKEQGAHTSDTCAPSSDHSALPRAPCALGPLPPPPPAPPLPMSSHPWLLLVAALPRSLPVLSHLTWLSPVVVLPG